VFLNFYLEINLYKRDWIQIVVFGKTIISIPFKVFTFFEKIIVCFYALKIEALKLEPHLTHD
jgi:hypothetical protein